MEQISVDVGKIQGAARQQTQVFNIRLYVAKLIKEDPDITVQDAIHAAVDHVLRALGVTREKANDLAPLLAFCDYGVTNNFNSLTRGAQKDADSPGGRGQMPVLNHAKVVERGAKEIRNALLKIILPSGRSLYDSTREEIVEFRGQQTKLISLLKPGQTPRQAGIKAL